MENEKSKLILLYLPVIHEGYLDFFRRHCEDGDVIMIIDGKKFFENKQIPELEYLERDLRAVETLMIGLWLSYYFSSVKIDCEVGMVSSLSEIQDQIASSFEKVIMPDDDVTAAILERVPEMRPKVQLEKQFLRWDKNASLLEKEVDVPKVSSKELPENVVAKLKEQIGKSVDWWRQVACVIYDDQGNVVLFAYNRHFPNDLALGINGDPRFNFKPSEHIENCSAIHAEAWAIAQAAREGVALKGLNMLVSDFPCPVCAKSIAEIGIKNLYYVRGYSKIDGQKTLEDRGTVIRQLKIEE